MEIKFKDDCYIAVLEFEEAEQVLEEKLDTLFADYGEDGESEINDDIDLASANDNGYPIFIELGSEVDLQREYEEHIEFCIRNNQWKVSINQWLEDKANNIIEG